MSSSTPDKPILNKVDHLPPVSVSVLVPTLNEERHIARTVDGLRSQRFHGTLEFLVIDGDSEDRTRDILGELAGKEPRLRMLENSRRDIPAALNIGLRAARGEFVARMDAHTVYPADYLATGVERLRRGDVASVSGPQIPHGIDKWSHRIALATSTRLGVGGATFRNARSEIEVDTGYTGVWRRETLLRVGGWDERWPFNEDAELAARIREAGGRIVCVPRMAAQYVPRNTLRSLARQYMRYGEYRAKTCRSHPRSMRRSHILTPALVLTASSAVLTQPTSRTGCLSRAALGVYATALATDTVLEIGRASPRDALSVPLVLAVMHFAHGSGFLIGSARFGPPIQAIAGLVSPHSITGSRPKR